MTFLDREMGHDIKRGRRADVVQTERSLFDVCERKHGGNENSRAAHERIRGSKKETHERILCELRKHPLGLTSKEIASRLGKELNTISGRFKEMRDLGLIITCEYSRDGASVHIARPQTNQLAKVG